MQMKKIIDRMQPEIRLPQTGMNTPTVQKKPASPVRMLESTIILSGSASTDNAKCIKQLFTRFAAIYGHIWKSQFKNEAFMDFAKKEWMDALGRFPDSTVTDAIDECREYHDMPPTLPQFIRCCKSIVKRQFVRVEEKPFTPARREVVELHIKKLRESLN